MKVHKVAIFIFLFALLFRCAYLLFLPQLPLLADAIGYDKAGMLIAQGRGFPIESSDFLAEPLRAPGYPLFLAAIYKAFGHDVMVVRFFQAMISSLACVLLYFLSMQLTGSRTVSFLSGIASVLYFPFISYSGIIAREAILAALLVLSMLVFLKARRSESIFYYILTGASVGISVLFDERMTYFPVFVFLLSFFYSIAGKRRIVNSLVLLITACAMILPWTIRNYIVFKEFIPVTRAQKVCFWLSTHPSEPLEWRLGKEPLKSLTSGLSNKEIFDKLSNEAVKNLQEHPFVYLKLSAKRFFRLWLGSHSNSFYGLGETFADALKEKKFALFGIKATMFLVNSGVILLGVMGFFIAWKIYDRVMIIITLLPAIYLTLIHTLSFSTPRYAVPMMPFIIIFSCIAVIELVKNRRMNSERG